MGMFDIFKVKEYKNEIERLYAENQSISEDLKKMQELQLGFEQKTIMELQNEINIKTREKDSLQKTVENLEGIVQEKEEHIKSSEEKINNLEKLFIVTEDDLSMESYGLYRPKYDFASALGYKNKLDEIREKQKRLIKLDKAVFYNPNWTVEGSKSKGRKLTNDNIKMVLRAFNNECEAAINKVKYNNFHIAENRILKSHEQINKLNVINQCEITPDLLKLKIDELALAYEYERKKESEKEALRDQREKEREDKALQKEISDKKKLIDKDIKHMNNVIEDLELKFINATNEEKIGLRMKIEELKESIVKYEEDKAELDYRVMNASAGYVYIISNIGAFGKDVYKIGVTRRLDPIDRINELSSAAVPFKFDIHAMIFSYNAYVLEAELHNKFDESRINRVNRRKEFFKASIDEIRIELEKYKELTIDFKEIPDAEEYRESLKAFS